MKEDNQPASKGDLKQLRGDLLTEIEGTENRLKQQMTQGFDEVMRHFEVVAEKIHDDVAGANKDEISLMKNQQIPNLNARLEVVEEKTDTPISSHDLFLVSDRS